MMLQVFNKDGAVVGAIEFDETILGEKVRTKLMHQAVIRYEANKRVGTVKTKSKAERAGSGMKPWKQKHTGRARAGIKRSPLWYGGGNAFGPHPRDYHKGMPVRMRREALKSALLSKIRDQELKVIDTLAIETPKTKIILSTLKALGLIGTTLVAAREPGNGLIKSVRNLTKCRLVPARNLNAYDLLKHKNVLLTKDSVEHLAEALKA